MNIVFWNCQGLRPEQKELRNSLPENQIDILGLHETFLKPKFKFHLPGYDIYKNNRLVGTKGGAAILVKKGIIIVNQEWKNEHFNVIVEIELQNRDKVILKHFRTKLLFSGTLTQNISNLDVSNQTNLVKHLLT